MNVKPGKHHLSALLHSPVHNEAGSQCGEIADFTLALRKNWPCFDQAVIFDSNSNCHRLAARKCFKVFSADSFVLTTPINELPLLPADFSKPTVSQLWDKSVIDTINVRTVKSTTLKYYSTTAVKSGLTV